MRTMTKWTPPHEPHAPDENPQPASVSTTTVIWVHDGPLCVTVVDLPPPHASSGLCRCPACLAHDPDRAIRYL